MMSFRAANWVVVLFAVVATGCGGRVPSSSGTGSESGRPEAEASSAVHAVNKIDLLFDIDNSASMGDKQPYLLAAIPDLIDGLVNPNCVDTTTLAPVGVKSLEGCPAGSKPEFPPVTDMHIGIVSSSLGPRLSEIDPTHVTGVCNPQNAQPPFQALNAHMDDRAHLLTRSVTGTAPKLVEGMVGDAASGFLYWYPETKTNLAPRAHRPVLPRPFRRRARQARWARSRETSQVSGQASAFSAAVFRRKWRAGIGS
jgi:hypothetical protein